MDWRQQVRLTCLEMAHARHLTGALTVDCARRFEDYVIGGETEEEQSNLVDHARRELELIGEEPETIEQIVKIVRAFADMRHSGGSASVVIPWINDLLWFKNLTPLTDDPDEWMHIAEEIAGEPNTWQNKRCSEAFSNDAGHSFYLLSEVGDGVKTMHLSKQVMESFFEGNYTPEPLPIDDITSTMSWTPKEGR